MNKQNIWKKNAPQHVANRRESIAFGNRDSELLWKSRSWEQHWGHIGDATAARAAYNGIASFKRPSLSQALGQAAALNPWSRKKGRKKWMSSHSTDGISIRVNISACPGHISRIMWHIDCPFLDAILWNLMVCVVWQGHLKNHGIQSKQVTRTCSKSDFNLLYAFRTVATQQRITKI